MNLPLPSIGDTFEFDYVEFGHPSEVIELTVVDVTGEHVMYKLSCSSYIYPMTHEVWISNRSLLRPKKDER